MRQSRLNTFITKIISISGKVYLADKRFTLQADHKPLKYLKDVACQNDRVFRWAIAVQEYSLFSRRRLPSKGQISGAGLDRPILLNGRTFIRKYNYSLIFVV